MHWFLKLLPQSVFVTALVCLLYVSGLAVLVPVLLPMIFYYIDIRYVTQYSEEVSSAWGGQGEVDLIRAAGKKSMIAFLFVYVIPATLIQLLSLFVIWDHGSQFLDLKTALRGIRIEWYWPMYKSVQDMIMGNNAYFIHTYKQWPLFGWKDTFFMGGVNFKFEIISFFYVMNVLTSISAVIVGMASLSNKVYRKCIRRMMLVQLGITVEQQVKRYERSRRVSFVFGVLATVASYVAVFNWLRLDFYALGLMSMGVVTMGAIFPQFLGWTLFNNDKLDEE